MSSASIPEDILQEIQQNIGNLRGNEILADLPGHLQRLSACLRSNTASSVSTITAKYFRSRPDLLKTLFFLGLPFNLSKLKLVDFSALELQSALPFVTKADSALHEQIQELILSERFDVIAAIIGCENFKFGSSYLIYNIILELINAEGQHGLLRALLQTPFPVSLLHQVAAIKYRSPILHHAVQVGNAAAVHELLSIKGRIDLNVLDFQNRTARSYADDGSEIAILLDGPSSV